MKHTRSIRFALLLFYTAMPLSLAAAGEEGGAALTILHSFGAFTNGSNPQAALVQGRDGNFYGTTYNGGTNGGNGTVFRIGPVGALTSLYSFTGGNDGAHPNGALVQNEDGIFYGLTAGGGSDGRNGTVFRITTGGALTSLYSFTGGMDGAAPNSLIQGSNHVFYGTTSSTIFKITPGGALTTLASISGASSLVQSSNGEFYGATAGGGNGTIFRMSSGGVLKTLYSFTGGDDGLSPNALVQGSDGDFYGTTYDGGKNGYSGTIFKITPSGTLTTLYSFTGGADGEIPAAALAQGTNGSFYGTTTGGGAYYDGTFFTISPQGAFTSLYSFPSDVAPPSALVMGGNGNFYGTTTGPRRIEVFPGVATEAGSPLDRGVAAGKPDVSPPGINTSTNGTVFEISPAGSFTNLYSFTGLDDGGQPGGSFFMGNDGNFYGTTTVGGISPPAIEEYNVNVSATIFEATPNGAFSIMYSFQGGLGISDLTLMEGIDGNFYGTDILEQPLVISAGSIFKIAQGGQFTNLYSFQDPGLTAVAALAQGSDGNFYGTTTGFEALSYPTIFRFTTNGGFTSLYSFTNRVSGAGPEASLVQGSDGDFYGSSPSGGSNNDGMIFQITTNGAFASLYSFTNGNDGANPTAALTLGPDGNFYGSSMNGGTDKAGTIFKITTNDILTSLYSFTNGTDGANPQSALVLGNDGNFYGFTANGGAQGYGSIFQITSNGAFTSLYAFAGGNEGANVNSLAAGADGKLYGTTENGGAGASGTLFRLSFPLAPSITREPVGRLDEPQGSVLTLSATVNGMPPLTFQWQKNGLNLSDGGDLSGSTSSALTFDPVMLTNTGKYRLIVSNSYGAVTSVVAALTVVADTVRPTIVISAPAPNARTTNGVISGTAADNAQVVAVNYWLTNDNNGVTGTAGEAVLGPGTTHRTWSISAASSPGSNTVMVQSVDFTGHKSPILARRFFYEVPSSFTLAQNGDGVIRGAASVRGGAPPTNGAMLDIGERYMLTATPAKNWAFSNWTSGSAVVSSNATLHFIMEPGYSLTANFASNFLALAAGAYNGLFYSAEAPAFETAGFLKNFVVTTNGAFSGNLLIDGSTNLLSGIFNGQYQFSQTIALSAQLGGPLLLNLNLGQGQITGTVSGINNGGWTNPLTAYRSAASSSSAQYTILIPPPASATNCPPGEGYALITNQVGQIVLTGALADGTAFSQSVPISDSGAVPIYQNLSSNNPSFGGNGEFLYGWINLGANPPGGWLAWIKKPWTQPAYPTNGPMPLAIIAPPYYWSGFTNICTLIGSSWTNPPAGTPAISLNNGTLAILGNGIAVPLRYTVSVNSKNTLVPSGLTPSNAFSGSINPKTGQFTITFPNGFGAGTNTGAGVWLQNAVSGGGYSAGFIQSDCSITLQK